MMSIANISLNLWVHEAVRPPRVCLPISFPAVHRPQKAGDLAKNGAICDMSKGMQAELDKDKCGSETQGEGDSSETHSSVGAFENRTETISAVRHRRGMNRAEEENV